MTHDQIIKQKVKEIRELASKEVIKEIEVSKILLYDDEFQNRINEKARLHIIKQRDFWGYCMMALKSEQ